MPRLLFLATCFLSLSVQSALSQPSGLFQSSIDGQVYELRPRGELGLDIYAPDGRVLAVLDRGKPTDNFKGRTDALATQCPGDSGKIETRGIEAGRIRMRVEVAQKNPKGEVRCHMFGFVQWRQYDLVKADQRAALGSGRAGTGGPVPAGPGARTASFSNVVFSVTGTSAQGKILTINMTVTNQGSDRMVNLANWGGGAHAATLVDDGGASYGVSAVKIGNQDWYSDVVSGVNTPMTLTFEMSTKGGTMQATAIKRLQLPNILVGPEKGSVEFRDIPIPRESQLPSSIAVQASESPSSAAVSDLSPTRRPAAVTAQPDVSSASQNALEVKGVLLELVESAARNNTLTIVIKATNQGADRQVSFGRAGPGVGSAKIIDDQGNTYGVTLITIGNQQWHSDLVNGISTTVTLTFSNMPTVAGVIQASQIARLTLPTVYVGQEQGEVEFRNIEIHK